ncbi:hypothetical protein PIB30_045059 [Stylosanthes scabra]|uniref:Uncharacterized protein n=1 Tax=Stylosanthes scabra TaxID=79078 RepID=A0ABU6UHC7_9FABA|nr:hypothetical protein [Stylosanthes scabra]
MEVEKKIIIIIFIITIIIRGKVKRVIVVEIRVWEAQKRANEERKTIQLVKREAAEKINGTPPTATPRRRHVPLTPPSRLGTASRLVATHFDCRRSSSAHCSRGPFAKETSLCLAYSLLCLLPPEAPLPPLPHRATQSTTKKPLLHYPNLEME